jgi:hypothetical protein
MVGPCWLTVLTSKPCLCRRFLDGQEGARIEDEDLPNITVL